jgi:hypothetical protein
VAGLERTRLERSRERVMTAGEDLGHLIEGHAAVANRAADELVIPRR